MVNRKKNPIFLLNITELNSYFDTFGMNKCYNL